MTIFGKPCTCSHYFNSLYPKLGMKKLGGAHSRFGMTCVFTSWGYLSDFRISYASSLLLL